MTHTYNISGMTCSGCIASVKSALLKLSGVTSAEVQLDAPQATITMQSHIPTAVLQQGLNAKYSITDTADTAQSVVTDTKEDAPSYYPIFLIFGYIAGVSFLMEFAKGQFDMMQWMSSFMAGFFLLFSFFKLLNLKGFAEGYSTYDVIAKKIPAYGYVYPFIELMLGVGYLISFNPLMTNAITFVIMTVSSIGVIQSLLNKTQFQCACLGTIIKLPLSKVTLVEDLLMVAMSGAAWVIQYR